METALAQGFLDAFDDLAAHKGVANPIEHADPWRRRQRSALAVLDAGNQRTAIPGATPRILGLDDAIGSATRFNRAAITA